MRCNAEPPLCPCATLTLSHELGALLYGIGYIPARRAANVDPMALQPGRTRETFVFVVRSSVNSRPIRNFDPRAVQWRTVALRLRLSTFKVM